MIKSFKSFKIKQYYLYFLQNFSIIWGLKSYYDKNLREKYKSNVTKVKQNHGYDLKIYPKNEFIYFVIFSEFIACLLFIFILFIKPYFMF
jgi:hypothetical protein